MLQSRPFPVGLMLRAVRVLEPSLARSVGSFRARQAVRCLVWRGQSGNHHGRYSSVRTFQSSMRSLVVEGPDLRGEDDLPDEFFKPEPDPVDDVDYDQISYMVLPTDEKIPIEEQKPDEFFKDDIPNIERLRRGKEMIAIGEAFFQRDSLLQAIEAYQEGISLLEQYVHFRYDRTTRKALHEHLAQELWQPYIDLSLCFQKAGRFKRAKVLLVKVLYLLRRDLERASDLAHVAQNLAEVYSSLGRPEISSLIARTHLKLASETMEPVHYAGALSNLSTYLADEDKIPDALGYGAQSLELFVQELGDSHPLTMRYLTIYLRLLAVAEEREVYQEVYDHFKEYSTDLPTFETMKDRLANPAGSREDHMREREDLERRAEEMLPQMERAQEMLQRSGFGKFSTAISAEGLPFGDRK